MRSINAVEHPESAWAASRPSGTAANVSATVRSSLATSRLCDGLRAASSYSSIGGVFSVSVAFSAQIVGQELWLALGARW
jgi:hypothetical protein